MKTILLASYSITFLERNRNLLKRTDFQMLCVTTGAEALRLMQEQQVDMVLADMQLGDMTGDALCSLLRSQPSSHALHFVLICHDSPDELARAEKCGANLWLTRPLQPVLLLKAVGQLLTAQMVRQKRAPLRVNVLSRKNALEFSCISHNVSVSGILLETEEALAMGDKIDCRFFIPGPYQIVAAGEVVRSVRALHGGHQYGVHFVDLPEECQNEIDQYVNSVDTVSV